MQFPCVACVPLLLHVGHACLGGLGAEADDWEEAVLSVPGEEFHACGRGQRDLLTF